MRRRILALLAASCLQAAPPAWWTSFRQRPVVESTFRQDSESQVFGTLSRKGSLLLGGRGRLRVVYETGLRVVCDGQHLVQYDPDTRTAQRVEVARAVRDFPLLGLLLDPSRLDRLYRTVEAPADGVRLVPRETGLPIIDVYSERGRLGRIQWTDPTGARQVLAFLAPRQPTAVPKDAFQFQAPPGTRWSTPTD